MAILNTTCPLCGAPHAKKLSVIHSDGLSNVNTSVNTVGTLNTIGRQKITTNGTVSGIQQTDASRRAAPPFVPPLVSSSANNAASLFFGGSVVIVLIGVMVNISGAKTGTVFLMVISMFVALFFIARSSTAPPTQKDIELYEAENKDKLEAYRKWENTFSCGSCGNRFIPEDSHG